MNNKYKDYFAGKKILMMGLGILGRGVNIAKFLAECGAELTITDLKTEDRLALSLRQLKKFSNIKYVLGRHNLADFSGKDMVIKAAGVPLDSPYVTEAKKNNIPVEMDASFFAKLAKLSVPNAIIVGITGSKGKSTTTHLIYAIIDEAFKKTKRKVYLGGNVKGLATLPLLKKIKDGDIVVMELDSWQLQGFGDSKISPNIAVFTTFIADHMNYYKGDMNKYFSDKANIYRHQKENDQLVVGTQAVKFIKKNDTAGVKRRMTVADKKNISKNWKIKLLGDHNFDAIALAVKTAEKLDIKESVIKRAIEKFKGLPGRLEFVKEIKSIKYYNDTTATIPEAVMVAIESFKKSKGKIILIGGGADKNLEYDKYAKVVKKYVKALILFRGLASSKIISAMGKVKFPMETVDSMKKAIEIVKTIAKKGNIVLLSPGAASFGVFKNEFDRGEQFVRAVKRLK